MNQTKKRLSIINLAISITDIETIQLQILKLCLLQTDLKIQEIITAIQAKNYAQAQGLITLYIETPTENVLQRTSQTERPSITTVDKTTIDEFQLFVTADKEEEKTTVDINDFYVDAFEIQRNQAKKKESIKEVNFDDFLNDALNIEAPKPKPEEKIQQEEKQELFREIDIDDFLNTAPYKEDEPQETKETITEIDINDFLNDAPQVERPQAKNADFDALLNIDADDVLTDNITLNISDDTHDTFFETSSQQEKRSIDTSDIPKDTFFDIQETVIHASVTEKSMTQEILIKETMVEGFEEIEEENIHEEKTFFQDLKPIPEVQEDLKPSQYKAIPYIAQKLESMQKQYPPVEAAYENFSTVENLLKKISQKTYTEEEIEETLTYIKKLIEDSDYSQAAQLMLICAATESKFAQFMLARELYKGTLLRKNVPEAFSLINTLAMDDYPEALCDLGQFYENGIGTRKDKKRALELYKEAIDLGIKRADSHHARLQKRRRGFFS
ncbi:MAG: hypothetical protein COB07_02220 [Sulfurovum sp.]|nr:MAG: hypothetical protein COB07_02220 [Sulfurovum sp.]